MKEIHFINIFHLTRRRRQAQLTSFSHIFIVETYFEKKNEPQALLGCLGMLEIQTLPQLFDKFGFHYSLCFLNFGRIYVAELLLERDYCYT